MRSERPTELDDQELDERLGLAIEIALEAAEVIHTYFQSADLEVIQKSDDSPVTVADREAELHLRERIANAFPGDGILGEEFGEKKGSDQQGFRWILDPIDGTESFIRGVPLFGTLIGIEFVSVSVGGVISLPALGEIVYASRDQGAWHVLGSASPQPAQVSEVDDVNEGLFTTTGADGFKVVGRSEVYGRLSAAFGKTRGWGDCYGYYLVATGRADLMVDPIMNVWDNAPLLPIIEEAGGRFTDWSGDPTILNSTAVATNGLLHDAVLGILAG